MVGLLAVARAVTALGRESFIPPIFSLVSAKLGTPIFTTAILGIVTGERSPSGFQMLQPHSTLSIAFAHHKCLTTRDVGP